MVALLGAACATRQVVPLTIEPRPAKVFVDGRLVAPEASHELSLRVDRGHVVLIRRAGHRPQQVVIESVERDGVRELSPARIAVRLVPERESGRRLEVELDAGEGDPPAAPLGRDGGQ